MVRDAHGLDLPVGDASSHSDGGCPNLKGVSTLSLGLVSRSLLKMCSVLPVESASRWSSAVTAHRVLSDE